MIKQIKLKNRIVIVEECWHCPLNDRDYNLCRVSPAGLPLIEIETDGIHKDCPLEDAK